MYLAVAAIPLLPPMAPRRWPNPWRLEVIAVVALGIAALFALAARREALGRRLRQSMAMLSAGLLLVAVGDALVVAMRLGVTGPALSRVNDWFELTYTSLGIAALFWMPLAPLRRHGRWLVLSDIAIAITGMTVVLMLTTTAVNLSAAAPTEHSRIIQYAVLTGMNLVALNIILVRGLERRVGYAVWLLAATPLLEIVYWVIVQVRLAHPATDARPLDIVFALDQGCYALAALSFLTDPVEPAEAEDRTYWWRDINPLPAVSVLAVGALLIRTALVRPSDPVLRVVACGMVIVAVLLIARVILASQDRLALLRDEADLTHQLQLDRVAALRRIAGGIAHEFNNLMTVVIAAAELGESTTAESESASHFQSIGKAGSRAAALTARLLTYAGGSPVTRVPLLLGEVLNGLQPKILEAGGRHATTVTSAEVPRVMANRDQIESAVMHLVSNSVAATPAGGSIAVSVGVHDLDGAALDEAVLPAGPGRYVSVSVADSGRGIPPADRRRVFDPFFSTSSLAVASGLGLAVVYGTIVTHGGAITVRDASGGGTIVTLYLPAAER